MTIFEKIIHREIPAEILHEDDLCCAFRDIAPAAPVHILVVPKKPVPRLAETTPEDSALLGHLLVTASALARREGLETSGFRITINNGRDSGESVPHLHVHLLGGRPMAWPPG